MGMVYSEITIKNYDDILSEQKRSIDNQEIREVKINALVDSGAWTMAINEETREKLGLKITRITQSTLANGVKEVYKMAGPIEIWWKDRSVICETIVLPNAKENLLGAIPLEAMDLTINPRTQELTGAHGDEILHRI